MIMSLTHVRNRKTVVVTERHSVMHRIYHLRSELGCAKLDSWPGGGGRAGVAYGDVILSSDELRLHKEKIELGKTAECWRYRLSSIEYLG